MSRHYWGSMKCGQLGNWCYICYDMLLVHLQGANTARARLQAAIERSHGSHTARWLTQCAWVCLHHGLKATHAGLQLGPVKYQLVSDHLRSACPEVYNVMAKLHTLTGQKYFRLMGTSQTPSAVLLRLANIILNPDRYLAELLEQVHIADDQDALAAAVHPPQAQAQAQVSAANNLDTVPKADSESSGKPATTCNVSFPATLPEPLVLCFFPACNGTCSGTPSSLSK